MSKCSYCKELTKKKPVIKGGKTMCDKCKAIILGILTANEESQK